MIDFSEFEADVSEHQMTIENDNDVFRSILFSRQESRASYFRIITWPNHLAISGDMGDYSFCRTHDMFNFFNQKVGNINPSYWSEKITSDSTFSPHKKFAWGNFEASLLEELQLQNEELDANELRQKLKEVLLFVEPDEHGAISLIRGWDGICELHDVELELDPSSSNLRMESFSYHFIWCLHAIVWGIDQYNTHKTPKGA